MNHGRPIARTVRRLRGTTRTVRPLSNSRTSTVMTHSKLTLGASLALAALSLAACAGPRASASATAPVPAAAPATHTMGPDAAKAQARADSLRYPYTQADIDFMRGMIHHHAQAIVISRWAPSRGADAEVIRLTARIINAQNDEIRLMQTWLRDRDQEAPEVTPTGMIKGHEGMDHSMHMPGMLSAEQLAALDAARGVDFDRLFLQYMIQHHRGAVQMVQALFGSHGAGQDETIFKFASDVQVDQTTEIRRMMTMLLARGGIPPQ